MAASGLVLHNTRIHTMDAALPRAECLVIENGEVVAVGGPELLARYPDRQKQDLHGRVILPGLTDAHLHMQYYSESLASVDCETPTLEECLRRVQAAVNDARPGEWVVGVGWNQNVWGKWPTAADLDGIAPSTPVLLHAKSLHASWTNSAALKLASISSSTTDPAGGRIQRLAGGEPDGILLESAVLLVSAKMPTPTPMQLRAHYKGAQKQLWSMGVTGVHDFDGPVSFAILQDMHQAGELRLRVTKSIPVAGLPHARALGLHTGFGDEWLHIGAVKAFMDGALGPQTAAMLEPYDGSTDNRGIATMDSEQLFELACEAAMGGLEMAVHAIGDRANHDVLQAFSQLRLHERERGLAFGRHRIEHVQLLHPDDVSRLAELGVIASMQPLHATSDREIADRYWGARTPGAYAIAGQLRAGARLALGSDAPVESPNPFWGIHAAVTRRRADGSPGADGWHPEQRITVEDAIAGYTTGPAYAAHMENRIGKLAPGMLADLIVLDEDPFEVDPHHLKDLLPSATMVGGQWVCGG